VKNDKINPTRRQFLALMNSFAVAAPSMLTPTRVLMAGLIDGICQKAMAQTAVVKPRNYVYIYLGGGPPRWCFDLPLNPYNNSQVVANPHILTRFQSGTTKAGPAIYQTVPVTRNGVTLQMPYLWSCQIPTSGGSFVPMADLMSNMLMMRGVNMGQDGHASNTQRQTRPLMSEPSLDGAVADMATTPLPSVNLQGGPGGVYRSRKGIGQVSSGQFYSTSNPIGKILAPFDRKNDGLTTGYLSRRDSLELSINAALSALGKIASSSMPGAENLYSMRSDAEKLLKTGFGDLKAEYFALYQKYAKLVSTCATSKIPGVSDKPVLYADLPMLNTKGIMNQTILSGGSEKTFCTNPDLTTLIQTNTVVDNLAENFAVAEYLIKNKYTTSVGLGLGGVNNLAFLDRRNETDVTASLGDNLQGHWGGDEHVGGSINSLLVNSFMYRSLAACLYEFVSVLKANGLFNETVIHIGSEFSRDPDADQKGSQHGWMAAVTSVISGAIDRPMVLGNVRIDDTPGTSAPGTFGGAAPVRVDNVEQELTIGHATSTVCELLRIKTPLPNNGSLISVGSGGISPTIEYARNR
jgi:hypothetical protein